MAEKFETGIGQALIGGDDRERLALAPTFDTQDASHECPSEGRGNAAVLDLSLPDGIDSIKEQLGREVARARRQKASLSFALLGIDLFGQIDDTYGQPAGSRVVQALAHLLKQRLREADLVGRYGGEEFAIILVDADGGAAAKVMNGVREDFSRLCHMAEGKEFFATFSCGVADISRFGDAACLGDAAEAALDRAKRDGRNRVVLAQEPPGAADAIG
jgi:diguanylate cyclase (GGDEF)-like protein